MAYYEKINGTTFNLVSTQTNYDPLGKANSQTTTYIGTEEEINDFVATIDPRLKYNISHDAVKWQVVIVDDINNNDSTDQWTIKTELVQSDAFAYPLINQEMSSSANPAGYKKVIETGIKEGSSWFEVNANLDAIDAVAVYAPDLYVELQRGATHWEDSTIVLTRSRTFSLSYPTPVPVYDTFKIYTKDELPLPNQLYFSLSDEVPEFATKMTNTMWGWRLRGQTSTFVGNKVEQNFEWILGAHSLLYYTPANESFPD